MSNICLSYYTLYSKASILIINILILVEISVLESPKLNKVFFPLVHVYMSMWQRWKEMLPNLQQTYQLLGQYTREGFLKIEKSHFCPPKEVLINFK